MNNLSLISIVIATFNSAKLLPRVLQSLKDQTYPQNKIEILVLDGGSSDHTLGIARDFGCKIINNPRTEPVYAKFIGYRKARGKYLVYLDSDEVIENKNSLFLKIKTFKKDNRIKAVIGSGYKNPKGCISLNYYLNEFGDPFSFFIYRLSKSDNYFLLQMKKRYPVVSQDDESVVFDLSKTKKLPIIELAAAGSMFDREYLKKIFPETLDRMDLLPHYFYLLNSNNTFLAIINNDPLVHYSLEQFREYLNKIRWRVKNNIHHLDTMGFSGFSGRDQFQPSLYRIKKYFFIPYSFSIVFPLIDSLYLTVSRRKLVYLVHLPLCFYTAVLIIYHYCLKILGQSPQLRSYDGSKVIK